MERQYKLLAKMTEDGQGMIAGFVCLNSNDQKEVWGDTVVPYEHDAMLAAADMVRAHVDATWTAYRERLKKIFENNP